MAKKSMIERAKKKRATVEKYAAQRAALVAVMKDANASGEDKQAASAALAKLPRNSSKTRVRNRCHVTGRPRGFLRAFGVSRIAFRELALAGDIPGIKKASW
ncbi:MAG: 30S ribosomal protein S14 [Myxococcota bacterium]|nr:30S ribosomal protein S14 [Myxococcota bacterium]